jgi:hypothetical protein
MGISAFGRRVIISGNSAAAISDLLPTLAIPARRRAGADPDSAIVRDVAIEMMAWSRGWFAVTRRMSFCSSWVRVGGLRYGIFGASTKSPIFPGV